MSLLFDENNEMIKLVVNSMKKDLASLNDAYNCLVLHALASVASKEMSESLLEDVQQLMIAP